MNITNLEMAQATVEIFGGFACLMSVYIIVMNRQKRKSVGLFRWMFIVAACIFFAEAGAYIFRGNTDALSLHMTRFCNFAVFLLNYVVINYFVRYIYTLLKEKEVVPSKLPMLVANVGLLLAGIILVVNIFSHWMYYFDESNYYHRNNAWYVYTAISLICMVAGACLALRYRKHLGKATRMAICFYVLIPFATTFAQTFMYGVSLATLGMSIGLILLLLAYLKEWSESDEGGDVVVGARKKNFQIVAMFFIMVISMSASIVSCIISINRMSSENIESNSQIIAHMVSESIENEFIKPITVAKTMANDYTLVQYMKRSGSESAESVEEEMKAYLSSIRDGFDYQMTFAVGDGALAYYTYNGIGKFMDLENDPHDVWYRDYVGNEEGYELNVDTDEVNNWELSVFVNAEIVSPEGEFLGLCGVGVEMEKLKSMFLNFENQYDIKVDLVNKDGLIQVDSQGERIETDYIPFDYASLGESEEFYYENLGNSCILIKYMENLGLYLVVEDKNPDRIDVVAITLPSIVIFIIGILMMGLVFGVISIREQKAEKELAIKQRVSVTDEMTGLYNRRAYEEDVARIKESQTVEDTIIVMMDVNGLKTVNDNLGHNAGDELIIGAANSIKTIFEEYGRVYRTGGDEFVALLNCSEQELKDALVTFEHVLANWNGVLVKELAISKGVVVCAKCVDKKFEEMVAEADRLMYEDKAEYYRRTGKDRRRR